MTRYSSSTKPAMAETLRHCIERSMPSSKLSSNKTICFFQTPGCHRLQRSKNGFFCRSHTFFPKLFFRALKHLHTHATPFVSPFDQTHGGLHHGSRQITAIARAIQNTTTNKVDAIKGCFFVAFTTDPGTVYRAHRTKLQKTGNKDSHQAMCRRIHTRFSHLHRFSY